MSGCPDCDDPVKHSSSVAHTFNAATPAPKPKRVVHKPSDVTNKVLTPVAKPVTNKPITVTNSVTNPDSVTNAMTASERQRKHRAGKEDEYRTYMRDYMAKRRDKKKPPKGLVVVSG